MTYLTLTAALIAEENYHDLCESIAYEEEDADLCERIAEAPSHSVDALRAARQALTLAHGRWRNRRAGLGLDVPDVAPSASAFVLPSSERAAMVPDPVPAQQPWTRLDAAAAKRRALRDAQRRAALDAASDAADAIVSAMQAQR